MTVPAPSRVSVPLWPQVIAAVMGLVALVCGFLPAYSLEPANNPSADTKGFQSYLFPLMLGVMVIGALATVAGTQPAIGHRLRLAVSACCLVLVELGIALTFDDNAGRTSLAAGFWTTLAATVVQAGALMLVGLAETATGDVPPARSSMRAPHS